MKLLFGCIVAATAGLVSSRYKILSPQDFVVDSNLLQTLEPRGNARTAPLLLQEEMNAPILPPYYTPEDMPNGEAPQTGPTLLRTQLAVSQEISIFASYVRDFASLEARFNDNKSFSIVLAPSNDAVTSLAAKPWEFPNKVGGGEQEQDRAARNNILSFISHHVYLGDDVSEKALNEDGECILTTESGDVLFVQRRADKFTVALTDRSIVANVIKARNVENGVFWVLDHSLAVPN